MRRRRRPCCPSPWRAAWTGCAPASAEHQIDALVVTTLANVRYLTGFSGSAGVLTVSGGGAVLTTDGRYRTQSAEQVSRSGAGDDVDIVIGSAAEQRQAARALLTGTGMRVGLEADNVTWNGQRTWTELLDRDLVATANVVEALRQCKDPAELDRMERAAAIADAALFEVLPLLGQGVSEEHFALELDSAMRRGGAEGTAFETIVASGENSAKPHHRPGGRRIGHGDPVVVDFGATFEGYRSDMTRTFCVDAEPEGELARIFDVVGTSQAAGAAAVRPGVTAKEVDDVCRRIIAEAGWAERFEHGTGHGVGLDIHEAPSVSQLRHCYPRPRLRRHRRARRVRPRARWGPRGGHARRHRGRRTPPHPIHKGHPWQSRPMT